MIPISLSFTLSGLLCNLHSSQFKAITKQISIFQTLRLLLSQKVNFYVSILFIVAIACIQWPTHISLLIYNKIEEFTTIVNAYLSITAIKLLLVDLSLKISICAVFPLNVLPFLLGLNFSPYKLSCCICLVWLIFVIILLFFVAAIILLSDYFSLMFNLILQSYWQQNKK